MGISTVDLIYNQPVDYSKEYRTSTDWKYADIEELKGKIVYEIQHVKNGEDEYSEDELYFKIKDNSDYKMFHNRDCCETVWLESIDGDLKDLLNSEILTAECVTEDYKTEHQSVCQWTFYKLSTVKGYVTLRWNGLSDGYYSIEVDFKRRSI